MADFFRCSRAKVFHSSLGFWAIPAFLEGIHFFSANFWGKKLCVGKEMLKWWKDQAEGGSAAALEVSGQPSWPQPLKREKI